MESKRSELLRASPRMFENDLLDRLSRVHHYVPLALFLPAITVFLYLGFDRVGTAETLLLALGGYFFWSLSEYWIHRAIFHWEPERGWGAKLHWMIHGVHHDHPNDPLRLVMPPAARIPLPARTRSPNRCRPPMSRRSRPSADRCTCTSAASWSSMAS